MATNRKTKHERAAIAAVAIVLGAAVSQRAVPQDAERLTVDVHDCLALEKRDERLACFEAQVEAAQQHAAPVRGGEPVEPSTAPAAASTAASASSDAAVESRSKARNRRSDDDLDRGERAAEQQPAEIVAKVAELRETVPNAYVITLDNGQVWRQAPPMAYPLRPGLEVRVHRTKFGYRLTAPELRGQIQVERVP